MAQKFCSACGTPLEDSDRFCPNCGKPVGAEGAAAAAKPGSGFGTAVNEAAKKVKESSITQDLLGMAVGIFKDPSGTAKKYAGKKSYVAGIIAMAVSALLSMLIIHRALSAVMSIANAGLGAYGSLLGSSYLSGLSGSFNQLYLTSFVMSLLSYALVIGAFWLCAKYIFKKAADLKALAAMVGAASLIISAGLLGAWILSFISVDLASVAFGFAAVMFALALAAGLREATELSANQVIYLMAISLTVAGLLTSVISRSWLKNIASSMLSGLYY